MAQYSSNLKQGLWIFVSIMNKRFTKEEFKECEDRTKARFSSWNLKMTRLRWKIQTLLNQAYRRTHQNVFLLSESWLCHIMS